MCAGLICENIGNNSAAHDFRKHIRAIADEADRDCLSIFARLIDHFESFVERRRDLVAVAALQSLLDSRRIDFDTKKHRAVHGGGEGLGAAHPAKAAG